MYFRFYICMLIWKISLPMSSYDFRVRFDNTGELKVLCLLCPEVRIWVALHVFFYWYQLICIYHTTKDRSYSYMKTIATSCQSVTGKQEVESFHKFITNNLLLSWFIIQSSSHDETISFPFLKIIKFTFHFCQTGMSPADQNMTSHALVKPIYRKI